MGINELLLKSSLLSNLTIGKPANLLEKYSYIARLRLTGELAL